MRFREAVAEELKRSQRLNPRYSLLRAFARVAGLHHSTVSRLLRSDRPMSARTVSTLAKRLGFSTRETAAFVALEDEAAVAMAIERSTFRPDSRWLASVTGISIDRVNIALHALLRCGRLRMLSRQQWAVAEEGLE